MQTDLELKQENRAKFKSLTPRAINWSKERLVRAGRLAAGDGLPLVIEPEVGDVDLRGWAADNVGLINRRLLEHGGILFRNFRGDSPDSFSRFVRTLSDELLDYFDQHTPRTKLSNNIYTSTEYPADHRVPFHSENSKNHSWPMKIWFYCVHPSEQGGETPIADNRKVLKLIDPSIQKRFIEKKVMYVRNFGGGLGLSWQTVFQTDSESAVERMCEREGMEYEWKEGNRLKVRHVCQAVATHPTTGDMVWFNQAHLFHVSSLDKAARESLLSLLREEDLPSNSYYGDGSPIEESVLDEIRHAYDQSSVSFPWQKGDILMLDNMLIAHGRAPYVGKRKVLVAMAELFSLK
jgi:alpha-ketoglutarate-dependent taurine dioxygenase